MVTLAHVSAEAEYYFKFSPVLPFEPLTKGVDLFFVISGFIIYHASLRLQGQPAGFLVFARNRWQRVVPLYFLFTTLMVAVLLIFPSGVKEGRFDVVQIISSYTFIPYARYDGRTAPVLSLGWTLNYEVFFYVIYAASMAFAGRRAIWVCSLLLLSLVVAGTFVSSEAPAAFRFWTRNILLEFFYGLMVGYAYNRWGRWKGGSLYLAIGLAFISIVALYLLNHPMSPYELPRSIAAGIPSLMILVALVLVMPERFEPSMPRIFVALGDSSYSLYLSHRFVLRPVRIVLERVGLNSAFSYVLITTIGALFVGHVIYLFLERPIMKFFKRSSARSMRPSTAQLS